MKVRYWDSVVLLGILKNERDKVEVCRQLMEEAKNGEFKILTSAITLTEVVHLRTFERLSPENEEKIKAFFEHDFIVLRNVDRRTAEHARELMWRFHSQKLRHQDSIHAATAALANVDVLNTYDPDLLDLNEKILRTDGEYLRIKVPEVTQPKLPFTTP